MISNKEFAAILFDEMCLDDTNNITVEVLQQMAESYINDLVMDELDAKAFDYFEMLEYIKEFAEQDRVLFYNKGIEA